MRVVSVGFSLVAIILTTNYADAVPAPRGGPVGTCPFPDPLTHTVHLPHSSDCTKFYRCDHGKPKLDHCPTGLHFNPKLEVCDWPSVAGCEAGSGPSSSQPDESSTAPPSTSAPSSTASPGTGGPIGTCPFPDPLTHTVHLPHSSDCTKFYRCDHGKPKLDHCPAGLHFNPKLQVCDWPNVAGCEAGSGPSSSQPDESSSAPPSTSAPSSTASPGTGGPVGTCPFPDPLTHTVHLPHSSDCTKFYRCDHGKPKLDHCPTGLHFNPKLEVCDWPSVAGCEAGSGPSSSQPDESSTAPPSTSAPSSTASPGTGGPIGTCPFPDPLTHTVHLPHSSDCTKFYRCDHGKPKLDHCPAGLHFNPKLQVCDWPNVAGCEAGSGPSSSQPDESSSAPPSTSAPSSTAGPGTGGPVGTCPFPDPLTHTVHLPHSSDCTKFYRCDHGKPKLDHCPAGLHFNPKLQVCDWPNVAGCEAGSGSSTSQPDESSTASPSSTTQPASSTPAPSSSTTTQPASTSTASPSSSPPTSSSAPSTSSAPSSTASPGTGGPVGTCPFPDPLTHTVHLPHSSDCTKFYRCDHGKPKLDHCPKGLHFNPKLQVCDWPWKAGCKSSLDDSSEESNNSSNSSSDSSSSEESR